MTVNRQWLLAKRPEGMIGPDKLYLQRNRDPHTE